MASIKYKSQYTADDDAVYIISIDDDTYSGVSSDFKTAYPGIIYTYSGQDQNPFNPISTLKCSFSFLVTNATEKTFIQTMVSANEGRFKIKITKDGVLDFVGFVINDLIIQEDAERYTFQVTAIDGIGRLKGIDYNNAGTTYSGRATFLAHIFNCFDKFDFDYFHGVSDDFLATTVNWWEDHHVKAAGTDPLAVSNVDHSVFYNTTSGGKIKYLSCYKVLETILEEWGCHLRFVAGIWRLYQINEKENASFPEIRYSSDATQQSNSTTAYDYTIAAPDSYRNAGQGGVFQYLSPLRKIELTYNHNTEPNLLIGQVFNETNIDAINVGPSGTVQLGVDSIIFSSTLNFECTWLNEGPNILVWKLRLQVGTKYLSRSYNFNSQSYGVVQWVDYEADFYIYKGVSQIAPGTYNGHVLLSFNMPLYPGDIIFDFDFVKCIDVENVTISPANYILTYELAGLTLKILQEGTQGVQEKSRLFEVTNSVATLSSDTIELDSFFGDGPFVTTRNKIQVSNGTTWEDSANWKVDGTGTAYSFSDLLIREMMSGRITPAKQYAGPIKGPFTAIHRLIIGTGKYIMQGGSLNTSTGIWNGTWFLIDTDPAGPLNSNPEVLETDDAPIINPDPGGGDIPDPEEVLIAVNNGQTGLVVQSGPEQTSNPITAGFVEVIYVPSTSGNTYQAGDIINIVDPSTGATDSLTVATDTEAGGTEIEVFGYVENNYPSGAQLIPSGSQTVVENQLSGEIVASFFESGALIDKEDYFLKTTIEIPETKEFQPIDRSTSLVAGTNTEFFWTIPPHLNGSQIRSIYTYFATAGTTGDSTIEFKKNGAAAFHTATIATGTKTNSTTLPAPEDLATGDEITARVATVSGTAPIGLGFSFKVYQESEILLKKIAYTLNRIHTADLVLWHKLNHTPRVPIGTGSAVFSSSNYIDCGSDSSLAITGAISISVWAKFNDFTSTDAICGRFDTGTGYTLVSIGPWIRFDINGQSSCAFSTSGMIPDKWYHIAGTYDNTDAKIYLDGELKDTAAYSAPTDSGTNFFIGAHDIGAGANFYTGSLCLLSVWARDLTREEVITIMNKTHSRYSVSENNFLVSHWPLGNLTATTAPDSYGSNDGTIT